MLSLVVTQSKETSPFSHACVFVYRNLHSSRRCLVYLAVSVCAQFACCGRGAAVPGLNQNHPFSSVFFSVSDNRCAHLSRRPNEASLFVTLLQRWLFAYRILLAHPLIVTSYWHRTDSTALPCTTITYSFIFCTYLRHPT